MISDFKNEKERIEFDNKLEGEIHKYQSRTVSSNCMFIGCKNKAVFSHAISKKSALSTIAENGKLVTMISRRSSKDKSVLLRPTGTNSATTFRGFCTVHEAMFAEIDKGSFRSERAIFLQAFRTITYCAFRERTVLAYKPAMFQRLRSQSALQAIKAHLLETEGVDIPDGTIGDLIDGITEHAMRKTVGKIFRLDTLRFQFQKAIEYMSDKSSIEPLDDFYVVEHQIVPMYMVYKRVSRHYPVAISTKVAYRFGDKERDFFFILVPSKSTCDLLVIVEKEDLTTRDFVLSRLASDLGTLNLIESVMLNSDDWYISPTTINSISDDRKQILEQDLFCIGERGFLEEYDGSIFDRTRLEYLDEPNNAGNTKEQEKVKNVPQREAFSVRKARNLERINRAEIS